MVAQFSPRQHNILFEHLKSDSPLIILQSAKKFNGEKTGTQLSYVPKICPSTIWKIKSNSVSIPVSYSRIGLRVGVWMKSVFFSCWKTSFSLRVFCPRSPVLRRTLTRVPDKDDGTCGGVLLTLISNWCEECRHELLVPMLLRVLPVFFTFLNIL